MHAKRLTTVHQVL